LTANICLLYICVITYALEKPYEKPTLILTGGQDTLVGYRELMGIIEIYPRASLLLLDRAAHSLQMEPDGLFTAAGKDMAYPGLDGTVIVS